VANVVQRTTVYAMGSPVVIKAPLHALVSDAVPLYPVPCGTKTCCIEGSTCVNGSCESSKNSKTSSAKVLNGHEAETGKIMTRNIGKYIRQQIKAFDEV